MADAEFKQKLQKLKKPDRNDTAEINWFCQVFLVISGRAAFTFGPTTGSLENKNSGQIK